MRQPSYPSSDLADTGAVARAVVRSLPDAAVFVIDHQLRFRFACGPVLDRLGWDVESLIDREAREILSAEYFALYEPHYRAALRGEPSELENDAVEGVAVFHSQFSPLRDGRGDIVGALVVARDVTERRAADAARRQTLCERDEAQSQFEVAFDDAPIGMALVGLDGAWLKVNGALCDILGWPADELMARTFQEITRLDDEPDAGVINELLAGRIPRCQIEKRCLTKAGDELWVLLSVSVVRDRAGAPRQVIVQAQDIDERRRLAEDIANARDEALELSRLKSEFVANMSHEIRTPLNGVLGLADLLLDGELNEDQREFAEAIRASGDALMAVITDVLDVSKIEAGKLELDEEDFDLRRVIDEACAIVAPVAAEKSLELMAWVDHDLAPAVRGDGNRVRQVLVNLLNNAVKFTERGEVVLRVSTRWSGGRPIVRFEVRDTGIGIDPSVLDELFEAFTQARTVPADRSAGTGLGLSICKQLVELMGGEIAAHSVPGRGSTFWFAVPLLDARGSAATVPAVDLAGIRVLVADDNATNRTILRHQLAAWNMECDCANDGAGALRLLRAAVAAGRPYALALIDRNMPGMYELELVHKMKGSPDLTSVPILILSSAASGRDALRRAGVDGVLTKPIGHSRLRDEINRVLGGAGRHPLRRGAPHAPRSDAPRRRRALPRSLGRRARADDLAAGAGVGTSPTVTSDAAPRVLLAEDNEINQMVAVNVLEKCGYRVDLAQTGREAVEMSRCGRYQAIFMDCRLPELDGYSAASEIRRLEAAERHTPIIAITAHTMRGDREKCLAAGMDEYIAKPLRRETLEVVLSRALPRRVDRTQPALMPEPRDRSASALDNSLLGELDEDSAARIAQLFVSSSRTRVAELAAAIEHDDAPTIRRLTHGLKGAAASVGAVAACRACDRLASAAAGGATGDRRELLLELEHALERAESALSVHYPRKALR
jgi:PAS domain S-box-containing protein